MQWMSMKIYKPSVPETNITVLNFNAFSRVPRVSSLLLMATTSYVLRCRKTTCNVQYELMRNVSLRSL